MPPETPEGDSRPIKLVTRTAVTDALPTPTLLVAWLAGHASDQTVGRRLSLSSCPLACYLSHRTGRTWLVNGTSAAPAGQIWGGDPVMLPPWLSTFTELVDAHPVEALTADDARDYLQAAIRHAELHGDWPE